MFRHALSRSFTHGRVIRNRLFSSSAESKLAFIGLGNMGYHMVNNLLQKAPEYDIRAFDVNQAALKKVETLGATPSSSVKEATSGANIVISMLPSNKHVQDVYEEAIPMLSSNCLCIDSSTIDPSVAKGVHSLLSSNGHHFVDAPVSGGVGGAEAGTLTFMAGGSEEVFSQASRVLKYMGANVVHCGDVGTGQVAKLCNNMILAISMIGVSEAMNLGKKLGIDQKVLAGILNTSTARCWSSDTYNPAPGVMESVPSSRNYEGGFGSALMLKDLGLVNDAAKTAGVPVPFGASAHAFYQLLVSKGYGNKDFSIVYKFLNDDDNS